MDLDLYTRTADRIDASDTAQELAPAWRLIAATIHARTGTAARAFDTGALVTINTPDGITRAMPAIRLLAELFEAAAGG